MSCHIDNGDARDDVAHLGRADVPRVSAPTDLVITRVTGCWCGGGRQGDVDSGADRGGQAEQNLLGLAAIESSGLTTR
jgi:hypothetical protein